MDNNGNKTVRLESHTDERGSLIAIESKKDIPFEIKRAFLISNVPAHAARGGHAYVHNEFALCLRGSCEITVSNGSREKTFTLDRPETGLLIPEMTWRSLFNFTPDCILLVLSDTLYDPADYIGNHNAFLQRISENTADSLDDSIIPSVKIQ